MPNIYHYGPTEEEYKQEELLSKLEEDSSWAESIEEQHQKANKGYEAYLKQQYEDR